MGKLHELLAAEPDLRAAAQREMSRVKNLFGGGVERFRGMSRKYEPLAEDGVQLPGEFTNLATNVDGELLLMGNAFAKWLDIVIQKETTNTSAEARAEVRVGEKVIFESLPATAILALEKHVAELRKVYAAIPTNDPTVEWTFDDGKGCFQSAPEVRMREEKEIRPMVLYEATPEHPAQVDTFSTSKPVGKWTTVTYSGKLSVTDRRERLERLDALLVALKEARMRANCAEAYGDPVGDKILDFINRG